MLQGHPKSKRLEQALRVLTGVVLSSPTCSSRILIFLDSGASQSIINQKVIDKQTLLPQLHSTTWNTIAGKFHTKTKAQIAFKLPSLHETQVIESEMRVTDSISNYDMIVGRDLISRTWHSTTFWLSNNSLGSRYYSNEEP
jgi:Retroviral aspartyl protease